MREWIRSHHLREAAIADVLGRSVSVVSRCVNRKRRLGFDEATLLHERFGIPFEVMQADKDL
ncbi:hypothetical protein [Bifidobacterium crudilactis]|jgi:antitoxin component HigA of HigAB toxin-antitoxin module|uniref:hypothetical protein n=1 Tax=Bifidobacterium crudilactis TaxID=327277 RepID=UPI0023564ABD|nr:hypothetical protein [Bifidobacterium crudilactis]MCI1218519.1 hypothetical protein [Bifidobacterium crudilactis]